MVLISIAVTTIGIEKPRITAINKKVPNPNRIPSPGAPKDSDRRLGVVGDG